MRPVAGGEVDGRPFYVAAILGSPALWGPAREAIREGTAGRATPDDHEVILVGHATTLFPPYSSAMVAQLGCAIRAVS